MKKDSSRPRRVGEQLRRELAVLLREEVQDPRVATATLCGVEVSRDLTHAKVYVSALNGPEEIGEVLAGLEHAAGFLRRELGRRLRLRVTPQLHFLHDTSMEQGARITELLAQAKAKQQSGS